MILPRHILALDPGKMSGVCIVDRVKVEVVKSLELATNECEDWLWSELSMYKPSELSVVCEQFKVLSGGGGNSDASWSLPLIGVLRFQSRYYGHGVPAMQAVVDAKTFATNAKLKSVGLWHRGGAGHAMDALRHSLLFMVNTGYRSSKLVA